MISVYVLTYRLFCGSKVVTNLKIVNNHRSVSMVVLHDDFRWNLLEVQNAGPDACGLLNIWPVPLDTNDLAAVARLLFAEWRPAWGPWSAVTHPRDSSVNKAFGFRPVLKIYVATDDQISVTWKSYLIELN